MFGLPVTASVALLLLVIIFIGYFIIVFNGLVTLRNNIEKSWANIDVLLKQRTDELPNLVSAVKGYMKHEKDLLENITKARTDIMSAQTPSAKAAANNVISDALKSIFAVAENYPKLQASDNFLALQNRISALENSIADRREFYNDSVNNFNIRIQSFPDMIVASMMKYTPKEMFKVSEADKKYVKVEI